LAEKASKWDGKPDDAIQTTCPYCAIGCRLDAWRSNGRVSKATPVLDPEVNDGQACLKGRFCMGEVSHHFERARKPRHLEGGYWKEIPWDEALDAAASKIKQVGPAGFGMLVSPDCSNEGLYVAQKLTRMAVGTNAIDTAARGTLGEDLGLWNKLFRRPISVQGISRAERILAVGLDTRFNFSIVGVEIRKALQRGAKLVTIDARESNLARYADHWLQPGPGMEGGVLLALAKSAKGRKVGFKRVSKACNVEVALLEKAAELLGTGEGLTVVVGPSVFRYSSRDDLQAALNVLMTIKQANIVPLYTGTNTRGAIEMGAFGELLPGPAPSHDPNTRKSLEEAWGGNLPPGEVTRVAPTSGESRHFQVLYLVGAVPFSERPDCDFLIVQDIFEPPFQVDLFLPAASFFETVGTLTNVEGRIQDAPRLEELPDSVMYGRARPDWWVFSKLAQKLGKKGFDYESADAVDAEISSFVRGFPRPGAIDRRRRVFPRGKSLPEPERVKATVPSLNGDFLLVQQPGGYAHRGVEITSKVEGLQILNPEEGFHINPEDAAALGVEEGERLRVTAAGVTGSAPARLQPELPRRTVYVYVPEAMGGLDERAGLAPLYRLKRNPCPVEVTKDAV
jgi:predicted molibdopterin-dependent oxidoreductase YjgC